MKWFILVPAALFILFGCTSAPVGEKAATEGAKPQSVVGTESTTDEVASGSAASGAEPGETGSAAEITEYRVESVSSYLANGVLDTVTKMVYLGGLLAEEQIFFGDGSPAGQVKHTYAAERVILSEKLDRFSKLLSSRTYAYDNRGNLITEELLDSDGNLIYAYRYAYDSQNRRSRWEILSNDGFVLSFAEYVYANGRNTRVEMFDAAGEIQEILERTFDESGNPVLVVISDIDNNELERVRFTYVDGMLAEKETHIRTRKIGSAKYVYDEAGKLSVLIRYDRRGQVSATDEYSYVEVKQ